MSLIAYSFFCKLFSYTFESWVFVFFFFICQALFMLRGLTKVILINHLLLLFLQGKPWRLQDLPPRLQITVKSMKNQKIQTVCLSSLTLWAKPHGSQSPAVGGTEDLPPPCGIMAQVTVESSRKVMFYTHTHTHTWSSLSPRTFQLWGLSVAPQISRGLWRLGLALGRVLRSREGSCVTPELGMRRFT